MALDSAEAVSVLDDSFDCKRTHCHLFNFAIGAATHQSSLHRDSGYSTPILSLLCRMEPSTPRAFRGEPIVGLTKARCGSVLRPPPWSRFGCGPIAASRLTAPHPRCASSSGLDDRAPWGLCCPCFGRVKECRILSIFVTSIILTVVRFRCPRGHRRSRQLDGFRHDIAIHQPAVIQQNRRIRTGTATHVDEVRARPAGTQTGASWFVTKSF